MDKHHLCLLYHKRFGVWVLRTNSIFVSFFNCIFSIIAYLILVTSLQYSSETSLIVILIYVAPAFVKDLEMFSHCPRSKAFFFCMLLSIIASSLLMIFSLYCLRIFPDCFDKFNFLKYCVIFLALLLSLTSFLEAFLHIHQIWNIIKK